MEEVIKVISEFYGVHDPYVNNKLAVVVKCRQVIWYYLRWKCEPYFTFKEIAQQFGKDTSTIQSGINRIKGFVTVKDNYIADELSYIERMLQPATVCD